MYYLKKYQKIYSEAELRKFDLHSDYGLLGRLLFMRSDPGYHILETTLDVFDKLSEVEREWNAHPEYDKGEMTFGDRGVLVTMYYVVDDDGNGYVEFEAHGLCVVRFNHETKRFEQYPDGVKYLKEMYYGW